MEQSGFYWSRYCKDCFSCKRKRFTNYVEFKKWLDDMEFEERVGWEKKFKKHGQITAYWCEKSKDKKVRSILPGHGKSPKPGMFCVHINN